jgi:hypothetical protein
MYLKFHFNHEKVLQTTVLKIHAISPRYMDSLRRDAKTSSTKQHLHRVYGGERVTETSRGGRGGGKTY